MHNWPFLFKVLLACKSSCLVLVLVHIFSGRDGGSWCLKYLFNSCLASIWQCWVSLQIVFAWHRFAVLGGLLQCCCSPSWRVGAVQRSLRAALRAPCAAALPFAELWALGWLLWHRLSAQPPPNAGQPLQVPLEPQPCLAGTSNPSENCVAVRPDTGMGTAVGFLPCPLLRFLLLQRGNPGASCHSTDVFLLLELSSRASLLERIPWQQQHVIFLGRVAKI